MSRFFIDRPIFAWVLAIIVMMAGALAVLSLPVAQYPAIAPPTISITANYPGASAKTLEDTVTQVIEQKLSGLDGLRFVSSSSDSTGTAQISVTFEPGTDPTSPRSRSRTSCSWRCRSCRRRSSARACGRQVGQQLPDDRRLRVRRRQHDRNDISDYVVSSLQDPVSACPGSARSRPSARSTRCGSGSTPTSWSRLSADLARRQRGDPGPERAGLGRAVRRQPGGARPAAQRDDHRADPAADRRRSSRPSSCGSPRPARRCACATSPASSSRARASRSRAS
jgi:hypothetical protein